MCFGTLSFTLTVCTKALSNKDAAGALLLSQRCGAARACLSLMEKVVVGWWWWLCVFGPTCLLACLFVSCCSSVTDACPLIIIILRRHHNTLLKSTNSLVDPASSHMLVSKIKPCMSKSKLCLHGETADGSLNQSWSKWASVYLVG